MRREILALAVHCTFSDDGCHWKGEVRHLEVNTCSILLLFHRFLFWSDDVQVGLDKNYYAKVDRDRGVL